MSLVLCTKCGSVDGVLCRECGKPNHFNRTKAGWRGDRYDRCWRMLRRAKERFKTCDAHEAAQCGCDACGVRVIAIPPAHGWWSPRYPADWKTVKTIATDKDLLLCPECQRTFRVGLDMALEASGAPTISESIACAFAFQLGQQLGRFTDVNLRHVASRLAPEYVESFDLPF